MLPSKNLLTMEQHPFRILCHLQYMPVAPQQAGGIEGH